MTSQRPDRRVSPRAGSQESPHPGSRLDLDQPPGVEAQIGGPGESNLSELVPAPAIGAVVPGGLIVLGADGTIRHVNERLCDLTGYPASELVGCTPPLPFWPGGDVALLQLASDRVAGNADPAQLRVVFTRRDGTRIPAVLRVTPYVAAGGGDSGWIAVASAERRADDEWATVERELALRALSDERAAFRRIALAVASGTDPRGLSGLLAREIALLFGVDVAGVLRFEPGDRIRVLGSWSADGRSADFGHDAFPIPPGGVAAGVVASRRAVRHDGPGDLSDEIGISRLAVPIMVGEQLWGILAVANRHDPLADGTEERLADFAPLAALGVANTDPQARHALTTMLETILTEAPIGFALFDRDLRYLRMSDALAEANGKRVQDHLGRTIREVLGPAGQAEADRWLRPVLEHGEPMLGVVTVNPLPGRADGERVWLNNVYPIRGPGGEPIAVGVVGVDITERQRAEQRLLREHTFSTALIGSLQDGLVVISPDRVLTMVNRRLCELTGYSEDELIGSRQPFPWWPPERAHEYQPLFDEVRANGGGDLDVEFVRRDGTRFPAIVSVFTLYGEGGTVSGFVATVKDVTERREAEHARAGERAAAEGLRRAIEAREAERARLSRELHDDTAQVLAAMTLHLEALGDYVPDADGREWLEQLREAAQYALSGVRDMAHDLRPPQLRDTDLRTAIDRVADRLRAEGTAVAVAFPRLPNGLVDEVQVAIFRVVQEALTNVLRHAGARNATVRASRRDDELVIEVADDGKGFDPTRGTTRLGLAGMRERVDLIGGTLEVVSSPDEGTCLRMRVPLPVLDEG